MPQKKIYYILLSLAVSVFLIWYLLSRIKIEDLLQTFTRIYLPALLAFAVISLVGAALRAWRYKLLLESQPVSWGDIFLVTLIRNLFVDLLPARIGSLSYIYLLNKRLDFSFEMATSSFVVALIFDFLTLSPFLVLAIFVVGLGSTSISSFTLLLIALVFFLIILIILWKIIPFFSFLLKIYHQVLQVVRLEKRRWAKISVKKINLTIDCLSQIRNKKIYWPIFLLSLFIRSAKYVSLYFLLFSLLKSHGFTLKNVSFWKTILGITGAELSSALPIQGIAGFGTWESAWALTFNLMNFDKSLAIISGMGVHLLANLFEYFLGIISILILAFSLLKKKRAKKNDANF
ncbi:MAG: lysylphosphatidylglycerol synthase transmembrane domain-containing protein [Candidatus Aminicenantaceae bacterium]